MLFAFCLLFVNSCQWSETKGAVCFLRSAAVRMRPRAAFVLPTRSYLGCVSSTAAGGSLCFSYQKKKEKRKKDAHRLVKAFSNCTIPLRCLHSFLEVYAQLL